MNPHSVGFLPNESPTQVPRGAGLGTRRGLRPAVPHREAFREGFTEDDEIVVRALAGAAGIAIDNSRLYENGPPPSAVARGDR